jgi:ADP-ribosylglycohydrolase
MKAWEYTRELTVNAVPVILAEEEQTWTLFNEIEKSADALLTAKWSSRVPGSAAPESVIAGAVQSMENMGYDVSVAEKILQEGFKRFEAGDISGLNIVTARLCRVLNELPLDAHSSYHKYTVYPDFASYQEAVNFPPAEKVDPSSDDFYDRTYASWIGRLCGGALGTALEGYTTARLRAKFGEIRGYVRPPNTYNDDITFEIAFLTAFEQRGLRVSSADIAEQWLALIPLGWSAEEIALENLRRGVYPPESGTYRNPYREWIGAQMRGAVCGQVAPGNPKEAARLAWLDGVISHSGNGVLGEVFNAVTASLAFAKKDIRDCLESAMKLIPSGSEYYSVLDFARDSAGSGDFASAWARCEERFQKYNWIHAYPNAAAEYLALWFGEGDFDETMHLIAMCGQDVDCNAAQTGAILGAFLGMDGISENWRHPLGGRIVTYLRGQKEFDIESLVQKTVNAVRNYSPVITSSKT